MVTIDQILVAKIGELMIGEWPIGNFLLCVIAMVLSVILCGAIGIERERKGRNAGLRTHLLVGGRFMCNYDYFYIWLPKY